jgi:Plant transposon protein
VLPDILRKPDALGNMGIHPLRRITGALRVLGYGYAYDAVDELIGIAESTMALTLRRFCKAVVDEFGQEYLREPNEDDMRWILAGNESRGFLGGLGSIDCQHWEWKNCPVALAGHFKGKEWKPTAAMGAIADSEVWIWHISVGHAGSLNYLNIMNSSSTMQRILSGEFPPKVK